jgi:hypothetical protein
MNIKASTFTVALFLSPVLYSSQSSENPGMTAALLMLSGLVGIVVIAAIVVSIMAPKKNSAAKSNSAKK